MDIVRGLNDGLVGHFTVQQVPALDFISGFDAHANGLTAGFFQNLQKIGFSRFRPGEAHEGNFQFLAVLFRKFENPFFPGGEVISAEIDKLDGVIIPDPGDFFDHRIDAAVAKMLARKIFVELFYFVIIAVSTGIRAASGGYQYPDFILAGVGKLIKQVPGRKSYLVEVTLQRPDSVFENTAVVLYPEVVDLGIIVVVLDSVDEFDNGFLTFLPDNGVDAFQFDHLREKCRVRSAEYADEVIFLLQSAVQFDQRFMVAGKDTVSGHVGFPFFEYF